MNIPMKGGRITAPFNDPRPIDNPGRHIHGAIDVSTSAANGDRMVYAPATGKLVAYFINRPPRGGWGAPTKQGVQTEKAEILAIPVRDRWYDVYGGLITIEEPSGLFHILTHFYAAQLFKRFRFCFTPPQMSFMEAQAKSRWPAFLFRSDESKVSFGEALLPIGDAGYSFGAHLHWEVHHSPSLDYYDKRIDPTTLVK